MERLDLNGAIAVVQRLYYVHWGVFFFSLALQLISQKTKFAFRRASGSSAIFIILICFACSEKNVRSRR